ncbi:MAG: fumarate reductase subunit C [Actinomycetota bacterium]
MTREYLRRLPRNWWVRKATYFSFMVRELTSLAVAAYATFLLVLVAKAARQDSFGRFFEALRSPASIVLHLVVLALVLYHTITWIALTPKILVVRRGDEQVSPRLIAASNYLAWAAISGVVAWLVLR